jgi:hypothetical protein
MITIRLVGNAIIKICAQLALCSAQTRRYRVNAYAKNLRYVGVLKTIEP